MYRVLNWSGLLIACVVVCGCGWQQTANRVSDSNDRASDYDVGDGTSDDSNGYYEAETAAGDASGGSGPDRSPERPMTALDGKSASTKSRPPIADTLATPADAMPAGSTVKPEPPPRGPSRRRPQSGLLTAGSFDDNQRFADYNKFLSDTLQNDAGESYPRFAIGRRILIRVKNEQGQPVGDARVVVQSNDKQRASQPILDLRTASDGRVLLLTGIDGGASQTDLLVTVHPPDGSTPVTRTMPMKRAVNAQEDVWEFELTDTPARLPKKLDLALVIDTTGSMQDELHYLKVEIDSIAAAVNKMFPGVDQRYALIVYRDNGDQYVTRVEDFTASISAFRAKLAGQDAAGGGDYPEAMHVAMEQAGKLSWRDRDTARVMFLVGDAPPHDEFASRTLDAAGELRKQNVRIFPVAASGVQRKAEFIMRAMSFMTLGEYLFLTDHSGVGNPHAKPHVPEYIVERLDRLMIRMIASELAGADLAPKEIIAIENGDSAETIIHQHWQQQQRPIEHPPLEQQSYSPAHRHVVLHDHIAPLRFSPDTILWLAPLLVLIAVGAVFTLGFLFLRLRASTHSNTRWSKHFAKTTGGR